MKIKFSTSSAAFRDPFTGKEDDYYKANECIRIMQDILNKIKRGNWNMDQLWTLTAIK